MFYSGRYAVQIAIHTTTATTDIKQTNLQTIVRSCWLIAINPLCCMESSIWRLGGPRVLDFEYLAVNRLTLSRLADCAALCCGGGQVCGLM